jgi:2-polyprenyl-3-methyl-5-hydroxy-6-metoxy-1,4-benzoquinol methylase
MNIYSKIYNRKSSNYAKESGVVISKFIELFISLLKDKEVLDLGCGIGHDTVYFFKRGIKVIGIDISPKMIEIAKKNYGNELNFEIRDILSPGFFKKYKKIKNIWISAVMMHINKNDRRTFLKKLNKFMDKEGIIGMFIPKKIKNDSRTDRWRKAGGVFDTFSVKEASNLLTENDFEIIQIKKFNFKKYPWWFILSKKKR